MNADYKSKLIHINKCMNWDKSIMRILAIIGSN